MSRIGKQIIKLASGTTVQVDKGGDFFHEIVTVTGPLGSLTQSIRPGVNVVVKDGEVELTRVNDERENRSFHGLYRSILNNMVNGVANGYKKELQIVGIGYRAEITGNNASFSLGYSHKISYPIPSDIKLTIDNQTEVTVSGIDKQRVGEEAAKIKSFRKPEPYKGKGVRYKGEVLKKKSAKKA